MGANETRQIRGIIRSVNKISEKVVKKITLDMTANLQQATPVDTGWARANWVPAIGLPYTANLENVRPTSQSASGARSQQQSGIAAVGGYSLKMGKVFVSNNVPYIMILNDGSSTQAPAGFVQRAIRKAVTSDLGSL